MMLSYLFLPTSSLTRVWGADTRECHSAAAEQEIYFLSGISFKEMIFSYYVKYLRKEAAKVAAVSKHLALHDIKYLLLNVSFSTKCSIGWCCCLIWLLLELRQTADTQH